MKNKLPRPANIIKWLDKLGTLLGIAFIFFGIFQIFQPAAWIVLGLILAFPGMPRKAVNK
jgi:hypothetical protein